MKLRERLNLIKKKKLFLGIILASVLIGASIIITFVYVENFSEKNVDKFPDFITKNEDYFRARIGPIPEIDSNTYRLVVWGQINNPKNFTLSELQALDLIDRTLTTECIGNFPKGPLLSTAVWRGFLLYDLLESLGLKENATGVRYMAADGYYVSHTLDQIRNNGTIGALYMNGKILPPVQGFPLRIVNPGSYGAKQPAWVIEIEVMDRPLEDYWDDRGWDTSPPMDVDSTIFFPKDGVNVKVGVAFEVGGAAFGGTRISKIEYTLNDGLNWSNADIVKSVDLDHVWVFWKALITIELPGTINISTKATDIYNNTQPMIDSNLVDGINSWPTLIVIVND